ncbi:MAG: class F sortase [Caldilineaceae bacterium]|nr:class F sortase [Caldilineaceae bacterium]
MQSWTGAIVGMLSILFVAGCQGTTLPAPQALGMITNSLWLSSSLRLSSRAAETRIAPPARLQIPRIGLDAPIETVGQTPDGAMELPPNPDHVAWYQPGVAPGEQGNAVISGHLDDPYGPAVFWRLHELTVGDQMMVVDTAGITRTFTVIGAESYPSDQAPLDQIFGFDLERDLNLITCDGSWDRRAKRYSERRVIYTRLVSTAAQK